MIEGSPPDFSRYQEDGQLIFGYKLMTHQFDPDKLETFGNTMIYADEDELELINQYTITRLLRETDL